MGDSVLDYCGLGNIVKGVKKRKKKCNPAGERRNCTFPTDDHLRSNESLHTLLSKLDIVEKKLEKFDQKHPPATPSQAVRGTVEASPDTHGSKLKVQLPDNWLELMKGYETSGNRPCLEVSVMPEADHNCMEEPRKGATCGRRSDRPNTRSRYFPCYMERRSNVLEESRPQEFGCPAGQRNDFRADSSSNQPYSPVDCSGPCGESPDIMSPSEGVKYSTFAPPLCSTEIPFRNNLPVNPGGGERECIEAVPSVFPYGVPSESSVFAPPLCSTQKPLSNRPPVPLMESECEEINSEVNYLNEPERINIRNISSVPHEPKRAEVRFDLGYRHNQKSPCTSGCCPPYTVGCGPEQNAPYTLGYGPLLRASGSRDQQLSCPSCRVVPPTSRQDGLDTSYSSEYDPLQSSSRCPSCRVVPPTSCQDDSEQNTLYTLGYPPVYPCPSSPSPLRGRDQQFSCTSCRVVPPTSRQDGSEQNTSYSSGYDPPQSYSRCPSCRVMPPTSRQDGSDQNTSYSSGYDPLQNSSRCTSCRVVPPTSSCQDGSELNIHPGYPPVYPYPSSPGASRFRDQQLSCLSCRVVPPTSCCQDVSTQDEINPWTSYSALPPSVRKDNHKTCSPSRNIKGVPKLAPEKSDGADMRMDASPNCFCAQAICMIQNCSKHEGQRQPGQKPYQKGSDESSCHGNNFICCCGICESQFRTLVVNIPRTPIVTSSPADVKSGVETRNYETQGSDHGESGRIAPIKSCECDIIKGTSRISKSSPNDPKSTPPPQKRQSELEKRCSLPRSGEKSPQPPHHENVDSTNNAALDNRKVASPRGSRPSKDTASNDAQSMPEKHLSPPDENIDSTHDAALDDKKVPSPKGSRLSKDNAENPAPHEGADPSLVIKDGVEFKGKGESQLPINPPDNNRMNFTASDLPPAPLLLSSPSVRRGFVPLPLPSLVAPSDTNLPNNAMECDLRSCSIKLPRTNVKRDLFIGEGTVLTSHPSNISAHNEYNGVDDTVSKIAPPSRSSPNKAVVEDSKAPCADVADVRNSDELYEGTMVKPCKRSMEDSANPTPQKLQNNPSDKHKPKDHSENKQGKGEQHRYKNKTTEKEANLKPAEQMQYGKAKYSKNGSLDQSRSSSSSHRKGPTALTAFIGKKRSITEKRWKMLNEQMKSKSPQSDEIKKSCPQRNGRNLNPRKCSKSTVLQDISYEGRSRPVSFHKGSTPEVGQKARKRACSRVEHLVRSNSLKSEKFCVPVGDRERQRIHKLARKSILKRSPPSSLEAHYSSSPSYHGNDTESSNHAASPAELPCFPGLSQLAIKESSNLNEKYLKELMLPFTHTGADSSGQDGPGTQRHVKKFVVERIIHINPRTQEMSQFTELTESKEEEEFVPENIDQLALSLEPFIGSKPEISGSSTGPTGFPQSTASQPSYTSGVLGHGAVSSNRVSDFLRETLIRFYGTDEEERSEHNMTDLLFHRLTEYDDPTDQPCDVFEDAFAGNKQTSSGGYSRKYERMEEFLRDAMLKSLYVQLGEAPGSRDGARDGFQNQASSMIFHQDTKRIIMAPRKLLASSSTEEHHQDNSYSSSEVIDVPQNSYDAFNDKLKELIWNSQFTPSDTPDSDKTVHVPMVDSQLVMALRVNSETTTDQNVVRQKSYLGLQKASAIMDLLEIFPGQHRNEDPQEEKTRKWIEKIHRKLENEKERMHYEKTIRAKVKKNRKRDYYIQKIPSATFSQKGCAASREDLCKKYRVPVQAGQSSSNTSMCDSSTEFGERDREEQRFLVYMNENGRLSKEKCKHGVSNRLPKEPTHWFRGTGLNGYSTVVQRISNVPSTDSRSLPTENQPVRDRRHTHRPRHHRHHHKRRGSSDDSLNRKRKSTRKKEIIFRKPKKQERSERQYKDVRVPRRSVSVSSSSDSSVHKKHHAHKGRHSYENDRNTLYTHDHGRHDNHRHSLDESHYGTKYDERRSSKTKRTSVDSSKQKNDQPKKSAMKKSNLKSVSSESFHGSDTSSSDSSSYTSVPSRTVKTHRSHDRPVKHSNQTARHLKVSHSPSPVKPVKVKKNTPNVLLNYRQRLITPDSKSSVGYEKVNVKDFIDFLATLSRNTISTLTNKKKALRLYRSYLSSPKR